MTVFHLFSSLLIPRILCAFGVFGSDADGSKALLGAVPVEEAGGQERQQVLVYIVGQLNWTTRPLQCLCIQPLLVKRCSKNILCASLFQK